MRLYIDNFNIEILDEYSELLKKYDLNKSIENYIELFTDSGIYKINNNCIYLLESIDKEIIKYNNYFKNLTLISDSSEFTNNPTTYINGENHISTQIKREIYKHKLDSKMKLVIESYLNENEYKSNNIYFECKNEINIKDLFIKQEIIEFLSILN